MGGTDANRARFGSFNSKCQIRCITMLACIMLHQQAPFYFSVSVGFTWGYSNLNAHYKRMIGMTFFDAARWRGATIVVALCGSLANAPEQEQSLGGCSWP